MKQTNGTSQHLICLFCAVCVFTLLASSSTLAEDLDLKKAILGKWSGAGLTIEFFKGGSVEVRTQQEILRGRYDVYGKDPTTVQQDEVDVFLNGSSEALPLVGKLSSATELTLTKSNGDAGKFTKVK
jgi:hypothetical protein